MYQKNLFSHVTYSLEILWILATTITTAELAGNFSRNYTVVTFVPYVSFQDQMATLNYRTSASLVPHLKIVHSQFSIISIIIPKDLSPNTFHSQILGVPHAVAEYNRHNAGNLTGQHSLQLWIRDCLCNAFDNPMNWTSRIAVIQEVVDHANLNFPGTVPIILTDLVNLPSSSRMVIQDNLLEAGEMWKKSGYKFGITLPVNKENLANANKLSKWTYLLNGLLDMVVLTFPLYSNMFTLESRDQVGSHISDFEASREAVKKALGNTSIPFGVEVTSSDTNEQGLRSYTNLVNFWRELSKWAGQTKTYLILNEAFDVPYVPTFPFQTRGWWRLVENGSYDSPTDFVFEDKVSLMGEDNMDGKPTDPMENHTLFNPTGVPNFLNHSVCVGFEPFRTSLDRARNLYPNVTELFQQFQLVATKFRKLFLDIRWDENWYRHSLYTVTNVARFNRRRQPQERLEVMLLFVGRSINETKATFEATVNLAEHANQIFPKTVTTLALFVLVSTMRIEDYVRAAQYACSRCAEEKLPLVIIHELMACNGAVDDELSPFREVIAPFLNLPVRTIILERDYLPEETLVGVDRIFKRVTAAVESCKRKINKWVAKDKRKIQVAFKSSWSDTDDKNGNKQAFAPLVNYWEMLLEWSVEKDIGLIFTGAFDLLGFGSGHTRGWFKYVGDEKHEPGVTFVDKKTLALQKLMNLSTVSRENDKGSSTYYVYIYAAGGTSLILVFIVTVSVTTWMIRKRRGNLTGLEIKEFFQGGNKDSCLYSGVKYDKDRLEIDMSSITIDKEKILGSGDISMVLCGRMKGNEDCEVDVAVKTTKKSSNAVVGLRGLVSEIKVLDYLGQHENIVRLLGACTARLKRGELHVILELCELGSLQEYLRERNPQKDDEQLDKQGRDNQEDGFTELLKIELERWAKEIVNGMEFLASKKVVHADLATRNILLSCDKTAKISDFGLSRRLYNYSLYVRNPKQTLPWRWMAPEAITRLEFTEKTDVWAFGVTLWEMYSLGDVPYPGLSLQNDFATKLENGGMRLEEPNFAVGNVYEIMMKCWRTNPAERPSFLRLKTDPDLMLNPF